jgi:TetR/AcrR family transcriptional regulator, transcriptional repressor for nem operon
MGRTSDARERLLQVAFELIWQQSYGSVSVDNICDRAGVKKGSFYYFFPSKSDLAIAAYEEHWQQKRPVFDQTFSPLVPPLERIGNYCRNIYEGQKEKKKKTGRVLGCPFASVACELSTQDERIRQKSQEIFERGRKYIEAALSDAQKEGLIEKCDVAKKSRAVSAFVIGMLLQAKVQNDVEILSDLGPQVLQLIGASVPAGWKTMA